MSKYDLEGLKYLPQKANEEILLMIANELAELNFYKRLELRELGYNLEDNA